MTSIKPWGGDLVNGRKYLLRGRTRCVLLEATDVTAQVQMEDGGIRTVDRTDLSELPPEMARSIPSTPPAGPRAGTRRPAAVSADPGQLTAPTEDLRCPECLAAGVEHEPYASPKDKGRHRWNWHGVESPHRAALRAGAKRRAAAQASVVPVPPEDPEEHRCVWRERYEVMEHTIRLLGGGAQQGGE